MVSSKLQQHLQEASQWMDDLSRVFNQVDLIERPMKYLQCLQHIEELSAAVQQCLMVNSVCEAIKEVDRLAALDSGLNHSSCSHLQNEFGKVLTQLHWPIISPNQSLSPAANCQDSSSQLEALVAQLLALQASDDFISQRTPPQPVQVSSSSPAVSVCLPIQIMLLPICKRFRYHFYGNRQTNSLHKPEWYLTQALIWMGSSTAFMEEKIQPVFDRAGAAISARVELCRGLVSLVQEKVAADAPRILYDDALFCHLVEEVLQFEKELRGSHSYPPRPAWTAAHPAGGRRPAEVARRGEEE
ncbi:RAD50-interacting protein 1 [Oryzias melastigma]|uniref:RAD50-interacting protein 1 n=1 Tax=Oryzias melastigma TaxID=30732 RepID=A0A834F1W2_ORYME|nr:RAD50-interacting protein 1 [Oryzias melastigma]